jgi:hypothetical protein
MLIVLIQRWLPSVAASTAMPHPFWIPVLLMSAQYGIMGGLFATLSATAVFFLTGLPPQSPMQDFYSYAAVVAAQPCAWFATALVLGSLRTLHIHHQSDVQERLDQTTAIADDLGDGLQRAVQEIELLERRIAGDSATVAALMRGLATLDATDTRSLLASVSDFIRFAVGATSFSIYLDSGGGLEPCLGVEDGARIAPTVVAPPEPWLLHAVRSPASSSRPVADKESSDRVPCWAPIYLRGATQPAGLIVCNRLEPAQTRAVASRRLDEVCRVLAALLPSCADTTSATVSDPVSGTGEHAWQ